MNVTKNLYTQRIQKKIAHTALPKHIKQTISLAGVRFWGANCDKQNESQGGGGS